MNSAIVLLNFGEPSTPEPEVVTEYLTNIFTDNADLEDVATDEEARERARQLADRRAPGLIEEYEAIGGSPLADQANAQADALADELEDRGYDVGTYTAMQYLDPYVEDVVSQARADGVDHLVALPIYPLCGPSTTVAALESIADAVDSHPKWGPRLDELAGWHRHPTYTRLRVDRIASFADERGVDFGDGSTALVFSAHGTPLHYVERGSRYVRYVEEYCETVATMLDVDRYELGYQNHENRRISWTEPTVESVVASIDTDCVVVDPVSFMHEQSETLSELDGDLREVAESRGVDFHRVPVPHDDPRFRAVLADLVEPFLAGFDPGYHQLGPCRCREGALCLNEPGR